MIGEAVAATSRDRPPAPPDRRAGARSGASATLEAAARHLAAGRHAEAEVACEGFLAERPGHPTALHILGIAAHQAGKRERALELISAAVAADPTDPTFHDSLGNVFSAGGDLRAAAAAHRRAIRLRPTFSAAHLNLGRVLAKRGDHAAAARTYRRVIALNPDLVAARMHLGAALLAVGDVDAAVGSFRSGVDLRPDTSSLHLNLALTLLQASRFDEGWREYEWRWAQGGAPGKKAGCDQPTWDGSPLAGRRILLVDEQGLGDTLQFIRYAPLVAARGGVVFAECAEPLAGLLATCPGIERLVVTGEATPELDLQIPLLSLPRIFATDLGTVPAQVPYLRAPKEPRPDLDAVLGARSDSGRGADTLRVGIVWGGSPSNAADPRRSCPLERFAPLFTVPGVELHSLQFGPRAGDLERLDPRSSRAITDLGPHLGDFASTAAVVERLDLVVTVDTSMAHLAGALGRPVWNLLASLADWRWLTGRADTPWYPTMRLFRQPTAGDWDGVMAEVAAALAEEARKRVPRTAAISPGGSAAEREAAASRPSSRGRARPPASRARSRRARSAAPAALRRRRG